MICMDTRVGLRLCLMAIAISWLPAPALGDDQSARASTPPDFRFASDKRSKRIPFATAAGHVFTQVRINNSEPLWFVLDSGAGDSVVDKRQAAALRLRPEGKEDGSGIGESTL